MAHVELKLLPPAEAIRFFRSKGFTVGFAWQDVWAAEHARAFTVAKAMRMDVLETIRKSMDRAIAEGRTFEQFRKELAPVLQRLGWWGRRRVLDPVTGKRRLSQLGSTRRLRTIFDVNMRSAYAAGAWQRIERTAGRRPFLRYSAILDERTRPMHRTWHGTVLPVNDAWWRTHYPPNGWRCRCTVRQLNQHQLDGEGLKVSLRPSAPTRRYVDRRNGRIVEVPAGIDPGFEFNAGVAHSRIARTSFIGKLDGLPEDLARAAAADWASTDLVRRFDSAAMDGDYPAAILPARMRALLGATAQTVRLSRETALKQLGRHGELSAGDYRRLQRILDAGDAWRQDARNLVFQLREDGRWYRVIVESAAGGAELFVTSYHRARASQVPRGRRVRSGGF